MIKKDIGVAFSNDLGDLLGELTKEKHLLLQMWRDDDLPKNKACAIQETRRLTEPPPPTGR